MGDLNSFPIYRISCPKCGEDGETGEFRVRCSGTMTAYVDGDGDVIEVYNAQAEISGKDSCQCSSCGYMGDFIEFEEAGARNGKRNKS